jgi:hypothetical protein
MKILQICDGMPGANTSGGGQVFYFQNLAALVELGHEVHLVACNPHRDPQDDVLSRAATVTFAHNVPPSRRSLDYLLARVFRPETLIFQFHEWGGLQAQVAQAVKRIAPDLIWADHIQSLLLAPKDKRIVYGHLDFLYQLQPVRRVAHRGRIRRPDAIRTSSLEKLEHDLCRAARFAVSVSSTDLKVFDALGVPSVYMPVFGASIAKRELKPRDNARAFLFGRSNTAMNMQRRNLREDVWPHVRRELPLEWHLVGEEPVTKDDTWRWFEQNFTRHGFIEDLGTVFSPGDLCLIPYKDDTGFRAKFVTAAAYGMVNIGYEETFRCAPEFVPGENCLAARDGAHFAELLHQYATDAAMRERLANASRALYDEKFTLAAHLPTYERILQQSA